MTEHADRITERDRPVITPEMIEAGEDAMDAYAEVASQSEMVRAIYIAMEGARLG